MVDEVADLDPPAGPGVRDGAGDRVLGGGLEGGSAAAYVLLVGVERDHVDQGHPAGGDRPGLVEHDGVDPSGLLEHLRAADEDPELRAAPGADHQRGGRGQPEGAGAGDHEDRDGCGQGDRPALAGDQPADHRECGERDHDRHEDRGDPVGQPLDLRLALLGLLDQPGHLRQGGVRADPGGAHHQAAGGVDAAAGDLVAGADVDGHRLAGEHRRVHGRGAGLDDPVGGDPLTGAHDHELVEAELLGGDAHLLPVAQHGRLGGREGQQGTQRGTGATLGALLGPAAGQQERRDAGCHLEVDHREAVAALSGPGEPVGHPEVTGVADGQRDDRPGVGGGHAHRDQGVHGDRAVAQVGHGRAVERPGRPGRDRGRQQQRPPLPAGQLQGGHHRQRDDRGREGGRDDQATAQGCYLPVGHRVVVGLRARQLSGVPCRSDGLEQHVGAEAGGEDDVSLLGGVVDRGLHAVELVELALDAVRAGGAGHPGDGEVDLVGLDAHASW